MVETASCSPVAIFPSFPSNSICGWAHRRLTDISPSPLQLGVATGLISGCKSGEYKIGYPLVKEGGMLGPSPFPPSFQMEYKHDGNGSLSKHHGCQDSLVLKVTEQQ